MPLLIVLLISALTFGCAGAKEIKDFQSDGCSLFPDRSLITNEDWCLRPKALRDCILKQTGDEKLAEMMYAGVRFGGSPYFHNWYRWGYGWGYERKYAPLSEAEKIQVQQKLERHFTNPPSHPCP
jgi:hypothetical protein